jgi:hypothetical protein
MISLDRDGYKSVVGEVIGMYVNDEFDEQAKENINKLIELQDELVSQLNIISTNDKIANYPDIERVKRNIEIELQYVTEELSKYDY